MDTVEGSLGGVRPLASAPSPPLRGAVRVPNPATIFLATTPTRVGPASRATGVPITTSGLELPRLSGGNGIFQTVIIQLCLISFRGSWCHFCRTRSPALLASGFPVALSILSRRNEFLRRRLFEKKFYVVVVGTHYDDLKCLVRQKNLTQAMQEI